MNLQTLLKPEYIYRPKQLLQRLQRKNIVTEKRQRVALPWNCDIEINVNETVGAAIWVLGIYDLPVSEALWRLIDSGECCVDAGANIGYMTSIMAARTGTNGKVHSFEPHPLIADLHRKNVALWKQDVQNRCQLHELGLSDAAGSATLNIPSDFGDNEGIAFISEEVPENCKQVEIKISRLIDVLKENPPKVMKVDVEGHELSLFKGAEIFLKEKSIRDIIFEEHETYPTPPMQYLEDQGYTLLRLNRTFFGPNLSDARTDHTMPAWEPANILATCEPERAHKRFAQKGWQVLSL